VEIKIKKDLDFNNILKTLSNEKKDREVIESYRNEFKELDREQRDTQIGKIQKDKFIGTNGNKKKVSAVRVPVAFANKIVNTSVGFEFGKPVTLTPSEENKLSEQLLLDWKNCRVDHKLQLAKVAQKQETQSALLFYFKDLQPGTFINKLIGANSKRNVRCRVLDFDSGEFYPYFDETGDMVYFIHIFKKKSLDDMGIQEKHTNHVWIYDTEKVHKLVQTGTKWDLEASDNHGFKKIPVVYMSQDKPEHYLVQDAIDRIEVAVSKLGASNDYSGHPILFIEGEVMGLPDKNADGKAMKTKVEYEDGKKVSGGDAKFLTHDNAPDSVKLEIEKLEDYIYSMTSTPNISFSNLKSVGNVSGKALELMFLDTKLKKLLNEGQNRTDVERCINVLISGIITTTKASYSSLAEKLVFDIEFGEVLPNSFDELVQTVAQAVESGIMSKEKAVELLGVADDLEEELSKINSSSTEE
jgi:SPP1 family phage portal protein